MEEPLQVKLYPIIKMPVQQVSHLKVEICIHVLNVEENLWVTELKSMNKYVREVMEKDNKLKKISKNHNNNNNNIKIHQKLSKNQKLWFVNIIVLFSYIKISNKNKIFYRLYMWKRIWYYFFENPHTLM